MLEKKGGIDGALSAAPIPASTSTLALHPNEIVRLGSGPKFFGLKKSQLSDAIKDGLIPKPFALVKGGRAMGWTGRQIIEHQDRQIEAAHNDAKHLTECSAAAAHNDANKETVQAPPLPDGASHFYGAAQSRPADPPGALSASDWAVSKKKT